MPELVLALDLPDRRSALALLDQLTEVRWVKVGSVLFTAGGPSLIEELAARGIQTFLDLKWHDIPNTVAGAVRAARGSGVAMATVHALGGRDMIRAASDAAEDGVAIVAVTVLTSHDGGSYGEAIGRQPEDLAAEVGRLARLAVGSGAHGVVCSPLEAAELRREVGPKPWLVTPGIRRVQDAQGDQARVATPAAAAEAGATHLVVGRPVLAAEQPARAWRELLDELAGEPS